MDPTIFSTPAAPLVLGLEKQVVVLGVFSESRKSLHSEALLS